MSTLWLLFWTFGALVCIVSPILAFVFWRLDHSLAWKVWNCFVLLVWFVVFCLIVAHNNGWEWP